MSDAWFASPMAYHWWKSWDTAFKIGCLFSINLISQIAYHSLRLRETYPSVRRSPTLASVCLTLTSKKKREKKTDWIHLKTNFFGWLDRFLPNGNYPTFSDGICLLCRYSQFERGARVTEQCLRDQWLGNRLDDEDSHESESIDDIGLLCHI